MKAAAISVVTNAGAIAVLAAANAAAGVLRRVGAMSRIETGPVREGAGHADQGEEGRWIGVPAPWVRVGGPTAATRRSFVTMSANTSTRCACHARAYGDGLTSRRSFATSRRPTQPIGSSAVQAMPTMLVCGGSVALFKRRSSSTGQSAAALTGRSRPKTRSIGHGRLPKIPTDGNGFGRAASDGRCLAPSAGHAASAVGDVSSDVRDLSIVPSLRPLELRGQGSRSQVRSVSVPLRPNHRRTARMRNWQEITATPRAWRLMAAASGCSLQDHVDRLRRSIRREVERQQASGRTPRQPASQETASRET